MLHNPSLASECAVTFGLELRLGRLSSSQVPATSSTTNSVPFLPFAPFAPCVALLPLPCQPFPTKKGPRLKAMLLLGCRVPPRHPPGPAPAAGAAAPAGQRALLEQGPGVAAVQGCCTGPPAQGHHRPSPGTPAVAHRGAAVRGPAQGQRLGQAQRLVQGPTGSNSQRGTGGGLYNHYPLFVRVPWFPSCCCDVVGSQGWGVAGRDWVMHWGRGNGVKFHVCRVRNVLFCLECSVGTRYQ